MRALAVPLLAALALAGCADRPNPEAVRLCRLAIPVLNPTGFEARVLRAVAPEQGAVRVDYVAQGQGRSRQRWVLCRFDRAPLGRVELREMITDEGAVSGASLYLMKRFWLDSPEALAADPAG